MNFHEYVPLINLGGLVVILVLSRQWKGPAQASRMNAMEEQQRAMRGNVARIDRDLLDWNRSLSESQEQILQELRSIQANGTTASIKVELDDLMAKVDHLEQTVEAMPCALHMKNAKLTFGKEPI